MKKYLSVLIVLGLLCSALVGVAEEERLDTWLTDELTTLTIATHSGWDNVKPMPSNDLPVWQEMERLTNVHIEWQVYPVDTYVEVSEEVLNAIQAAQRMEAAYDRRMYRHKAHYSLDYGNGIEKATVSHAPTPEDIFEAKQQQERLYAAVMTLPEKQAKRLYAHFYLGMTPVEIAHAEGVDPSSVRRSIRNGLKRLAKKFC